MEIELQLHKLLDELRCYEILRGIRWSEGVCCVSCGGVVVVKNGVSGSEGCCQHYKCTSCGSKFDDLSGTIFSGSHQGLTSWITCLYLMNLNVSMLQIGKELEISEDTAQHMCGLIREGVVKKTYCTT